MNNIISEYKEKGFYIGKNILSKETCKNLLDKLDKIKTNQKIAFTDIQYGYGNLLNTEIGNVITDTKFIKDFCKLNYKNDYAFHHLFVINKSKWVGPGVEWHQEVFNRNTFHPTIEDLSEQEVLDNYMQIYIPLEDQNIENGGLKIIPESHKFGVLKHYDIVNGFSHKRAIIPEELDKIYKKMVLKIYYCDESACGLNFTWQLSFNNGLYPHRRRPLTMLFHRSLPQGGGVGWMAEVLHSLHSANLEAEGPFLAER